MFLSAMLQAEDTLFNVVSLTATSQHCDRVPAVQTDTLEISLTIRNNLAWFNDRVIVVIAMT